MTHAASEGPDAGITRHLARCAHCSSEYRGLLSLSGQVDAAFPAPEKMSRESREVIAARLRNAVPERGPRRQRWAPLWLAAPVAGLVLVGAVFGLARLVVSRAPSHLETAALRESRATIRAIGPARFSRATTPPDEVVNLDEGSIELEVAPLHAGERFRVKTGDGEVEVRGTSFKVSAAQRRLVAVHVWRGRVEVRSVDGALAVLDAGDDWVRGPAVVAAEAPAPPPASPPTLFPAAAAPAVEPVPPALARPRPAGSHPHRAGSQVAGKGVAAVAAAPAPPAGPSFSHAWGLLRQGDARGAAAEFAGVQRLARGRDIEEDALYWRSVATGQAGDVAAARRLFDDFLERFPLSPRAGEAAVAFGRLLLNAGDTRAAREVFERAARDRSPQVRVSAQAGLDRIAAGP